MSNLSRFRSRKWISIQKVIDFLFPRTCRFPALFGEIENEIHHGGHLGIDSYGTSMPTLEEVFLRLGEDEAQTEDEQQDVLHSPQNN